MSEREFKPDFAILVAADTIADLRRCDVFRVLDDIYHASDREATAAYIVAHRGDLAEEVQSCMAEINAG